MLNRRDMRHVLLKALAVLHAEHVEHVGAGRRFLALRAVSGALHTQSLREQLLHLRDSREIRDDFDAGGGGPIGRQAYSLVCDLVQILLDGLTQELQSFHLLLKLIV